MSSLSKTPQIRMNKAKRMKNVRMSVLFSVAWSWDHSEALIIIATFHLLPQTGDGREGHHCRALKGQHEAVRTILGAVSAFKLHAFRCPSLPLTILGAIHSKDL